MMRPEDVPTEWVEKAYRAHPAPHLYGAPTRTDLRVALAAVLPEIQAQALRDAADDWQTGEWAKTPRSLDRVADRLGAAQYVCDWLRKRAGVEPAGPHIREVIAVHESGPEAWCPTCEEHWPCKAASEKGAR